MTRSVVGTSRARAFSSGISVSGGPRRDNRAGSAGPRDCHPRLGERGAVRFPDVPVMVFAFLFGLSMDYEVFILARMRDTFDTNGSTQDAVITGIGRTGRW